MKKVISFLLLFLIIPNFVFATDKIEINTASLEQLDKIIGIGPALGQRIIDDRPFSSIDDLLRVKGIGEKTLQKIKDQGLAYVEGQTLNPTPTPSPTPAITYPSGVFINEILPSPDGADDQNEWIEIYNQNDFEVDLSGWKIQDTEGKSVTYVFPDATKILPYGYLILKRPDTGITLNNDKDGLIILDPNGKTIDSMNYEKAPRNQSYNKEGANWSWSTSLTPGAKNIITLPARAGGAVAEKTTSQKPTEVKTTEISLAPENKATASISSRISSVKKSLPILIPLALALFSATIILFLKKSLPKS